MAYGHVFTKEQDDFIIANYTNVRECMEKFNKRFGTNLSYGSIKSHANKTLKLTTGFRPFTKEMDLLIEELLQVHSYRESTRLFNKSQGTKFTQKQIQDHCTKVGIKRNHRSILNQVDEIIKENQDKTYPEIMDIINNSTSQNYSNYTSICVRANRMGISRPHRVWDNKNDKRTINDEVVSFSEYVRFIGNRWHRINIELQPLAMQVVKLQSTISSLED